jgi:hypothetical protein
MPTAGTGKGAFTNVSLYGWSRGYVGFRAAVDQSSAAADSVTMVSTFSTDGLHWTAGRALDIEGLKSLVDITQVVEGPSGLLAVGRYPGAGCGGPATVDALWTSTDGLAWSLVQPPADFASASVYTIDGGSLGYIASGMLKDGVTQAVWLSGDGRSWSQVPLPKSTFGEVVVDGATSFAAGYVVSGAVRGDEGCGGYALLTPSLWWSADGKSWTRSTLPGAAPANDAWMTVNRVSDHSLMAIATEWNAATQVGSVGSRISIARPARLIATEWNAATQVSSQKVWVTTDGRTWNVVASPSSMLGSDILTNGQRGLVVVEPGPGSDGPPTVATVGDDLTVKTLSQTGDVPIYSAAVSPVWLTALGPTGVVILSADGLDLWLGMPTAS